jgi:hypothetical protein
MSEFKPGDAVTYVPYHAQGDLAHPDCEHGIVTSINSFGTIFARFGTRQTSQGCKDDQLVHQFNRISEAGDGAPVGRRLGADAKGAGMRRWTPKLAIARSRRNVAGAVDRLRAVALEWGDVDEGIVTDAEELIRHLEQFADDVEKNTKERIAAGEHVGL